LKRVTVQRDLLKIKLVDLNFKDMIVMFSLNIEKIVFII
jgi:hypothetical protein